MYFYIQWRIQGANPAMAPHRSWQWSLTPSGAERVMIALRICRNVRILAPRIDVGYGFGPRMEKWNIKT